MSLGLYKLSLCWTTYLKFKSALGALGACKSAIFPVAEQSFDKRSEPCLFPWC